MPTKKQRGEDQAFPDPLDSSPCYSGLTVREYFAAKAMEGLLAGELSPAEPGENIYGNVAYDARRFADAMLAELAEPKE